MPKSKRSRRHYTTEQKVEILKEHLVDKVLVSEVCNKHQLQPSVFYDWLKQVHANLGGALTTPAPSGPSKREKELAAKVAQLEARLAKKDSVIAEIAAEYTQLKKELGEP
ncbi:MAG: transposase [Accumulibacter sp.]|jgi:transposase-like protein|uniref:transposase n=1 Tax=Accumulibacter sp. TaxID=2053492 RepID=UPI00331542A7